MQAIAIMIVIHRHMKNNLTPFLNSNQKNQEGKIIIVYDCDEVPAHRAATTLVERGYENLFMLSGGRPVFPWSRWL